MDEIDPERCEHTFYIRAVENNQRSEAALVNLYADTTVPVVDSNDSIPGLQSVYQIHNHFQTTINGVFDWYYTDMLTYGAYQRGCSVGTTQQCRIRNYFTQEPHVNGRQRTADSGWIDCEEISLSDRQAMGKSACPAGHNECSDFDVFVNDQNDILWANRQDNIVFEYKVCDGAGNCCDSSGSCPNPYYQETRVQVPSWANTTDPFISTSDPCPSIAVSSTETCVSRPTSTQHGSDISPYNPFGYLSRPPGAN